MSKLTKEQQAVWDRLNYDPDDHEDYGWDAFGMEKIMLGAVLKALNKTGLSEEHRKILTKELEQSLQRANLIEDDDDDNDNIN